jgi:hypothetical protein
MTRRRLSLLFAAAGVLAAIAGTLTGRWVNKPPSPVSPVTSLQIDPKNLYFGEAWETDRFVWRVPIQNPTSEPVRVTTLTASCACVTPGSVSELIPPGQSREIAFELDLRNSCASAEPVAARDAQVRVAINVEPTSAAPRAPWVFRGRVRTAVTVPVQSIDLGRTAATSRPRERVVPVRALTDLSDLAVAVDHPTVVARLKPASGSRSWDLVVGRVAPLPTGHYKAEVSLQPVTRTGQAVPPVRIPVEFDLLGDVQPDAPTVVLGTRSIGEVAEGVVTLTSLSGRPFRVEKWSADAPSETELRLKDSGGVAWMFTCRQRVLALGHQATGLKFAGTDADGHLFVVPIAVRYYGVPAP